MDSSVVYRRASGDRSRSRLTTLIVVSVMLAIVASGIAFGRSPRSTVAAGARLAHAGTRGTPACPKVGQQPSLRVPRGTPGNQPTKRAIILACGHMPTGKNIQIVGAATNDGICLFVDTPTEGMSAGVLCKPSQLSWESYCRGNAICLNETFVESSDDFRYTSVTGEIGPDVMKVVVSAKIGLGAPIRALVAESPPRVLNLLNTSEPIRFFGATLPGCVSAKAVKVEGLDPAGAAVGTAVGYNKLGEDCQP
jgi:hypothetical protein